MNLHRIATRIATQLVDNPFPGSKIQHPVYHGTGSKFTKFRRPPQGVWFAGTKGWVDDKYGIKADGGEVIPCYVNVKNPYEPTEDEFYELYDFYGNPEKLKKLQDFFAELKSKGFDAYVQGGESESIAVFDTVDIVNAITGDSM